MSEYEYEMIINKVKNGIIHIGDNLYLLKKGESYYIPSDEWRSLLYNCWSNKSGYCYIDMPYSWSQEHDDIIFKLGSETEKKRVYCLYDTTDRENGYAQLFIQYWDKDYKKRIMVDIAELPN